MADGSNWLEELINNYSNLQSLNNFTPDLRINGLTGDANKSLAEAYANQDWKAIQGILGSGYSMTADQEKWLDNMIASQNTDESRKWEEEQSSTDILKAGNQLQQLGLSASGVLQTGGSSVNGVAAADNVKSNLAQNRYNQRMALAKQLLSMTSSMASAGIYGRALGAAKKASGIVTSAASHSAYSVLHDKPLSSKAKKDIWNWAEQQGKPSDPEYGENYNPGFGYL